MGRKMNIFRATAKKAFFLLQLQVIFINTSAAVCPFAMDLAFLLDSSGSIGKENYQDMKGFMNEVIEQFHVSPTDTHVGVVSFSSSAKTEISFISPQNVDAIKSSVLKMIYRGGSTRMDLGLNKTHVELFSARGQMRANVPHVLLAITDGRSDYELRTKQQSQHLKDDGIIIFALGIGPYVHSAELKALASDESHVFRFMSVRQMMPEDSALRIALALCSVSRTSNAIIHPMDTQHSLVQHTVMSRTTSDDLECAFMCIRHKSCYSFNFHTPSRLCDLSYAKRTDFPQDFTFVRGSVYSELEFA
ncbi:matrilin-1-like isoform X2 [Oculina patagonica]